MSNVDVLSLRLGNDQYANLIGARLIDFFNGHAPWQRRLWDVGTCMLLDEVVEAVEWRAKGVLSASALSWLARDAERIIGRDPAAGDRVVKMQLRKALQARLSPGTRHVRLLQALSALIQGGYLERWRNLLNGRPSPERFARAMAAHLLDRGYSMPFLHRWSRQLFKEKVSLAELMERSIELSSRDFESFEVMLPFVSVPGAKTSLTEKNPAWRSASEVRTWLKDHAGDPKGVRQAGGFLYTFEARDHVAAAYLGAQNIDRILARSTLVSQHSSKPEPEGRIWVKGVDRAIRSPRETRNAFLKSLVSESHLYELTHSTDLDDALELLATMNTGSPGPAIASGWAAIESLFVAPTDPDDSEEGRGAVAADRVAVLVAASWPRSDLTTLSHQHRPEVPDLTSRALALASSNRERSRIVGEALLAGRGLNLRDASDQAAAARMAQLMSEPRKTLSDVEAHVASAMRRLYRQRNIVMHGGSTETLTLESTLRTCAPLVGASLDRIAHARLTDDVGALHLATKARLGIDLLSSDNPIHIVDLLE
ncbi:hypothetical protein [Citricoccus muralis]|uniref:Integrase n=1 Tax=Citricoccus muralis TaxID=169134 RepID=A0ABY8H754_9MICC|nr:hypothetical protein [Citricoccus muralis]WFP16861.1 hypothetical protein P8192_01670 [Citricoccus muralis]